MDVAYLAQLESRQEDVLKRLESLKAEVLGLAKSTGVSAATQNVIDIALICQEFVCFRNLLVIFMFL